MAAKATGVSRPTMAMAATASSPSAAMARVTMADPMGVASWVRIAGSAMAMIGRTSARSSGRRGRSSPAWWRNSGQSAVAAMATRAATEASAAPVRSSPRPKIRIGSSTAFTSAAQTVAIMARLASPWARSTAEPTMPASRIGSDGTMIRR